MMKNQSILDKYEDRIKNYSILEPRSVFGILKNIIPDEIYNQLIEITDKRLSEDTHNAKNFLAGRIYQGKQLAILDLLSEEFKAYVWGCCNEYFKIVNGNSTLKQYTDPDKLQIVNAWLVSQYKGDYNPVHTHNGKLSGVLYLKIPKEIINGSSREKEYVEEKQEKIQTELSDGKINFIFDNTTIDRSEYQSNWLVTPEEKVMYIFPSWLMHTVYPFDGNGERRCISFNLSYASFNLAGGSAFQ